MQGKLVLVVEDDAAVRRLLTELLRCRGMRVATLPDGERVLEATRRAQPAAVLLDICLPGKHGLTVLDELKADPKTFDVPVIVASAWCDSDLVARAMAAGAVGYLRKPFTEEALLAQVRSAVRGFESGVHTLPDEVRRVLREDRLTGLPNRLGAERALGRRLAQAQEHAQCLGVILIRVDGWDAVRDRGGEVDVLMKMLARDLHRRIRAGDAFGRWAEDTFLVAAPGCDLAAAGVLAGRLRRAAGDVCARAGWTVSAGYTSTEVCDPEELVDRCQLALDAGTPAAAA